MNDKYATYSAELSDRRGKMKEKALLKELQAKYGYSEKTAVQALSMLVNCVDVGTVQFEIKPHADLDLALIRFTGFSVLGVSQFPIFARDGADLNQGKHICRLGFPFAEFTNFEYDQATDSLRWTTSGRQDTPCFPIDGMVTRHLRSDALGTIAFEMTTPGLKGQSGGPAFDAEGRVWGMQFATNHLDLDFDIVDREVLRDGVKRKINDRPLLHVGQCIHVDVLKGFMDAHGVHYAAG